VDFGVVCGNQLRQITGFIDEIPASNEPATIR